MNIKVYKTKISQVELETLAQETYGDMVKGVVDLQNRIIALGGELHADCEEVLLDKGSKQVDLWGFNIYPKKSKEERLEYTSFINIRPKQGNFQIEIKDEQLRHKIKMVIDDLLD
jgi:hypothetical protein